MTQKEKERGMRPKRDRKKEWVTNKKSQDSHRQEQRENEIEMEREQGQRFVLGSETQVVFVESRRDKHRGKRVRS